MAPHSPAPLLEIKQLSIAFETKTRPLQAVRELSLTLHEGEILGLVGESGCGKSLTSLSVLGLLPQTATLTQGRILLGGTELTQLNERQLRGIRGKQVAYIPQDPMTSLNPVLTIGNQLIEILQHHLHLSAQQARAKAITLLDQVRIPQAKDRLNDYPHQFSGGMRQRVLIAMALACSPKLLIADEPTTALDVTVQAQILDLFRTLRAEYNLAILMITHDLGVVAELCDSVAVMYAGKIVEYAAVESLFHQPSHPYTQALLQSIPRPGVHQLNPITGMPPTLDKIPASGCAFTPRCPHALPQCEGTTPEAIGIKRSTSEHWAACHWAHAQQALVTR
ncbi:MAG: ABC transporter ATP-binding protein [Vampirovibrionales bacterium]|nr:ABC transporter ATP-binding protein [Vampirovibrionales bacterium]